MIRKVIRLQPATYLYLHAATLKVLHKLEFNDISELIQKTEDGNMLIPLEFCSACRATILNSKRSARCGSVRTKSAEFYEFPLSKQ